MSPRRHLTSPLHSTARKLRLERSDRPLHFKRIITVYLCMVRRTRVSILPTIYIRTEQTFSAD